MPLQNRTIYLWKCYSLRQPRGVEQVVRNTPGIAMIMFKPLPVCQNAKAFERGIVGRQFCSNFEARYLMIAVGYYKRLVEGREKSRKNRQHLKIISRIEKCMICFNRF